MRHMADHAGYKQFKVSLYPATSSAFKNACMKAGVSMASVISRLMLDYSNIPATNINKTYDYSTKRKRRAAVGKIIQQLKLIRDCEQAYIDKIPEKLQSSTVYENAEEFLSFIEEAIESLELTGSI